MAQQVHMSIQPRLSGSVPVQISRHTAGEDSGGVAGFKPPTMGRIEPASVDARDLQESVDFSSSC